MARTYKLDHFTKGTGASVTPLDEPPKRAARQRLATVPLHSERRPPKAPRSKSSTPLPPGHVRKKATGAIGRVKSVDAKAGTATVQWLKDGRASTVPLVAISRR